MIDRWMTPDWRQVSVAATSWVQAMPAAPRWVYFLDPSGTRLKLILYALALLLAIAIRLIARRRLRLPALAAHLPKGDWFPMLLVFLLSIAGRLAVWRWMPAPMPRGHDQNSYLLAADTFAHGRVTNPTPEFWTHFETYQELLHPTYMSKYPPGQGLALALGQVVFHLPFAGVVLSCALMCALLYWALVALMPRRWALFGSLFATLHIGWLSYWDDSYWGGAMGAIAGCLLFGSALRLNRRLTAAQGSILGFSVFLLAITRPYEGAIMAFLMLVWLAYCVFRSAERTGLFRALTAFVLVLGIGLSWMGYYNWRITGHALEMPASELAHQCEGTPALIFQRLPAATPCVVNGQKNDYNQFDLPFYLEYRTFAGFIRETGRRVNETRIFYAGAACTLVPLGLLLCWRNRKLHWLLLLLAIMFAGWELETWSHEHYYAPALPVFFAIEVFGFRALACWLRKRRLGQFLVLASALVLVLSTAEHFVQIVADSRYGLSTRPLDAASASKASLKAVLEAMPGDHLVLVHYPEHHNVQGEWVFNGYDIPSQRIIWAHALDSSDPDEPLICHYRDRHIWRIEPPDAKAWTPSDAREALHAVNAAQFCASLPGGDGISNFPGQ